MATDKLKIIVSLKDQFSKGFKNVGKSVDGVKGKLSGLKNTLFSLKSAILGLGVGVLAKRLMDLASEQDKAVAGMETALRSMGVYTKETSDSLQDLASEIQGFTNYGDEAVLMGQKFLVTYTNIGKDVLPRASMAMADLAALMGGDMKTAANMLGKASMGMTGQLSLAGIQVKKTTFESEGFLGILGEIEAQSKGQARAQREATGSMIAMGNSFGDIKEKAGKFLKILLEPGFAMFLEWFDDLNAKIVKLQREGKFEEYASNIAIKVVNSFESIALGAIHTYGVMAPIMGNFKKLFSGIWEWFTELPAWVQTSGLILAVMGGKKVKWTLAFLALTSDAVSDIAEEFKLMKYEIDESATELENATMLLEALRLRQKQLVEGKGWRLLGTPEERQRDLEDVENRIAELEAKIEILPSIKLFDKDDKSVDAVVNSAKEKLLSFTKLIKERITEAAKPKEEVKVKTPVGGAPAIPEKTQMKADLDRLRALAQTQLGELENLYESSLVTFRQYWDERREMINARYEMELELLQKTADLERDPLKKIAAETAFFVKEEEYRQASLKLTTDEAKAEEELAKIKIQLQQEVTAAHEEAVYRKVEAEHMLLDLQSRVADDLTATQAASLAEMDARHAEELERFKALLDEKLIAELGYLDEKEALEDLSRKQQLEKEKLTAEQSHQLLQQRLTNAENIAGGLADIFQDMYELSGKKSKEMFELQKKAAIAEAIISTAKAVSGALGTPPYGLGAIATAAIIALKGGLQIAKIKAQEMAGGGLVEGYSPHSKADNVPIKGTAGEFMQPVSAVRHLGLRVMEGIRKNVFPRELFESYKLPAFARSSPGSGYAEGGSVATGGSNFSVSVPISIDDSRAAGIAGVLQDEVEETVIRVMERELR